MGCEGLGGCGAAGDGRAPQRQSGMPWQPERAGADSAAEGSGCASACRGSGWASCAANWYGVDRKRISERFTNRDSASAQKRARALAEARADGALPICDAAESLRADRRWLNAADLDAAHLADGAAIGPGPRERIVPETGWQRSWPATALPGYGSG